MNLTILYWVLIAVMLVGIIGALVPAIPGIGLIVIAILIWGIAAGFANVTWPLIVALVVAILSFGVEYLAAYWGNKQVGGSHWSQIGAFVGLILGFFGLLPALPFGGPLLGILVGPILGAFMGEFLYRQEMPLKERTKLSLKVCVAVVVGSIVGNLIKTLLALITVIIFVWNTWPLVS